MFLSFIFAKNKYKTVFELTPLKISSKEMPTRESIYTGSI